MRTKVTAMLGTVSLTAGLLFALPATSAAAAEAPPYTFDASFGQTYTRGKVTWYNRSVAIEGEQKSVSPTSCRRTLVDTFTARGVWLASRSSSPVCGQSAKIAFSVPADVAGGAGRVTVYLIHEETREVLSYDIVTK
ncbi:hypothetical protein ABZ946_23785 [Streptomyces sp. NPDC046324]|uniref:hypothetical protein n=1 Tax=Streptomyces sp. NPDC046324 TaxID=3154915 RepID=UPI0033C0D71E